MHQPFERLDVPMSNVLPSNFHLLRGNNERTRLKTCSRAAIFDFPAVYNQTLRGARAALKAARCRAYASRTFATVLKLTHCEKRRRLGPCYAPTLDWKITLPPNFYANGLSQMGDSQKDSPIVASVPSMFKVHS